jgi:hypothetical protein
MSGATSLELQLHPAGRVAGAKDSFVLAPTIPCSASSWKPAAHSSTGEGSPTALSRTVGRFCNRRRQDHPTPSPDPKSP